MNSLELSLGKKYFLWNSQTAECIFSKDLQAALNLDQHKVSFEYLKQFVTHEAYSSFLQVLQEVESTEQALIRDFSCVYTIEQQKTTFHHQIIKIENGILVCCWNFELDQEWQKELLYSKDLLQILYQTQNNFLNKDDFRKAFDNILNLLMKTTSSQYGFIGEILMDKQNPYLKIYSVSSSIWNDETREFYKNNAPKGMEFTNLNNLFGRVIKERKAILANEPGKDPRSGGLPKGHPPLNSFMGLPIFFNGELLGMVGLANRPDGYKEKDAQQLDLFLSICGTILKNMQINELQKVYQDKLTLANERVQKVVASRSNLFNTISHELRTPLSLILSPATTLLSKSEVTQNKEIHKHISIIYDNALKLSEWLEKVLTISSEQPSILENNMEVTGLYLFFQNLIKQYKKQAEAHHQTVQLNYLSDKSLLLQLDQHKVKSIVDNLVAFAFHQNDEKGVVSINVKVWEDQIKIEVKDTGTGWSANDLQNIFNFSDSQEAGNNINFPDKSGLGMALAKELAELIQGSISISSSLGMGTSLLLSIPFIEVKKGEAPLEVLEELDEEEEFDEISLLEALKKQNASQVNFLIVEDNDIMLQYIQTILEPYFNIQVARNGEDALEIINKKSVKFDVIITDLMMPVMGGEEMLTKVRKIPSYGLTPVIVLTAVSDTQTKLNIIQQGIDDYLLKPFMQDELLASVLNILGNQLSKKENNLTSQIEEEIMTEENLEFLNSLKSCIDEEIDNANLNIADLSKKLFMSERQLYRQVQKITGMTPLKYLQEIRLQRARALFEGKKFKTVTEICYATGFNTVNYFSKLYAKRFGKKTTDYDL